MLEVKQIKYKVLDILSDGKFHSGESLGQALGISRAAVWKQLQKMESMGLQLESVKGKGYRLPDDFELLNEKEIIGYLTPSVERQLQALKIHQSLDSTNRVATDEIQQRQSDKASATGTVIMAEYQSNGRGRRGKDWISPFASNIYLSIIWDFYNGTSALQGLSLSIGVAVRRALTELSVDAVSLKWPNDIYVNDKKLGGILLEMVGDPAGQCTVIIGIGINVSMPIKSGQVIDQQWTDIRSCAHKPVSRNQLVALVIENCFKMLIDYEEKGFANYRDEWQASDAFKGKQGTIISANQSITGIILGVDNIGALKMRLSNGEVTHFIGGELSLRANDSND